MGHPHHGAHRGAGSRGGAVLTTNVLGASTRPRFFEVADPGAVGITPPPIRHAEAFTTWARSLGGMQKEALVASARTGRVWRVVSDEGAYLDGDDEAPCPLAFFTAGMLASHLAEVGRLAMRRGLALPGLRLTQDNYYTMEGSMLARTMTGGARPIELRVDHDGDLPRDVATDVVTRAVAGAPLHGLVQGVHPSRFSLTLNGRTVPPGRVAAVDEAPPSDPADRFDAATPRASALALTGPRGPTPAVEGAGLTSAPGSSLTDHQSRVLRIGGEGHVRPDGLAEILQLQYSPRGTRRLFVAEEPPPADGPARAPDALSLASAGLALCFMTQLGRFAAMTKRRVDGYRLVQHTQFSRADPGLAAGPADPVETHVFLDAGDDEAGAREILDMSEQTCFLHALCRTDTETIVTVT